MKNEFFWMQKNDKHGNTIAFINRLVVDATIVAEKIMRLGRSKEVLLAKTSDSSFKITQHNSWMETSIVLDGVVQEKDDVGRQIGFVLLKEMSNQEISVVDILNIKDDVATIMNKLGCHYDDEILAEIIDESVKNYEGDVKNVLRKHLTTKTLVTGLITLVVIVLLLTLTCCNLSSHNKQLSAEVRGLKADIAHVQSVSNTVVRGIINIAREMNKQENV